MGNNGSRNSRDADVGLRRP